MNANIFLGAGISGIAGMKASSLLGEESLLLDRNRSPGGLTRSMYVDGFTFDYTGHFLHLAKTANVSNLTGASDVGWQKIARRAFCYINGEVTEAPFQYNLGDLSAPIKQICWDGFMFAKNQRTHSDDFLNLDLDDYFRQYFGDPITDLFLKPYNEKIFSTTLDRLSVNGISRFFPGPDYSKVESGLHKRFNSSQVAYNSFFYYPTVGGIQRLVDDLGSGIQSQYFDFEEVDPFTKKIFSKDGDCLNYLNLFPSLPLPQLLSKFKELPIDIKSHYENLSWNKVICFQMGVSGKLGNPLDSAHWIYVPDPKIPFLELGVTAILFQVWLLWAVIQYMWRFQ